MKIKVQLGCISVLHEIWLPYSVGCLISHATKNKYISEKYEFLPPIYKYKSPEEYTETLKSVDILGLTCYSWNQGFNQKLAEDYKKIRPEGKVIFGGPNLPKNNEAFDNFKKENPFCDVFIVGPGEIKFSNWLLEQIGRAHEPDVAHSKIDYQVDLPTPYTDGIFQSILNNEPRVKASIETNRGCPYRCTYCDWGGQSRSKIVRFDSTAVRESVKHLWQKESVAELEILDANFGTFPEDLDLVIFMKGLKESCGRGPSVSYSGLAKNGSKYLRKIIETLYFDIGIEERHLKISLQTHSSEALKLAKRENIRNDKLQELTQSLVATGVPIVSEMIIGLPGETFNSWVETLATDFSIGIRKTRAYVLNVLPNTELSDKEYQSINKIKTKKLFFPCSFNQVSYRDYYSGKSSLHLAEASSYEELTVVTECGSYTNQNLIEMFDVWWVYHNLINSGLLRPLLSGIGADIQYLKRFLREFTDFIGSTDFLKKSLNSNRDVVKKIFSSTDTVILDIETYWFAVRSLRTSTVFNFWLHQETLRQELYLFFDQFDPIARNQMNIYFKMWTPYKSGDERDWVKIRQFFGTDASILSKSAI